MPTYEIYLNSALADSTDLEGLAVLKYESALLLGDASLVMVVRTGDPVLDGRHEHKDGGWAYVGPNTAPCPVIPGGCRYLRKPEGLNRQRNALRVEIISPAHKCGWDLKDGRIGGHNSDYRICRRMA